MNCINLAAPDGYRVAWFVTDTLTRDTKRCQHVACSDGRDAYLVREVVGSPDAMIGTSKQIDSYFKSLNTQALRTSEWVGEINEKLVQNQLTVFCSLVLSVLDAQRDTIEFVNAGHPTVLQLSRELAIVDLGEQRVGVPIGIIPAFQYASAKCEMRLGDLLFLRSFDFSDTLESELHEAIRERLAARSIEEGTMELVANLMLEFAARSETNDQFCVLAVERTYVGK